MKFPQLSIGQRFTWQGRGYTKSGPVAATDAETGQSRMIPRSAEVTLVEATPPPSKGRSSLPAEGLGPALAAYRKETIAWAQGRLAPDLAVELEQAMEEIAGRIMHEPR